MAESKKNVQATKNSKSLLRKDTHISYVYEYEYACQYGVRERMKKL